MFQLSTTCDTTPGAHEQNMLNVSEEETEDSVSDLRNGALGIKWNSIRDTKDTIVEMPKVMVQSLPHTEEFGNRYRLWNGFPGGSVVKNLPTKAVDVSSVLSIHTHRVLSH